MSEENHRNTLTDQLMIPALEPGLGLRAPATHQVSARNVESGGTSTPQAFRSAQPDPQLLLYLC